MLEIELSEIKRIEAEVQNNTGYISLSQGALRVGGVAPEIRAYLQEVLRTDVTDYYQSAWGILPLREKIAATFSAQYNTSLTSKNVLVTHGCVGALSTILLVLLDNGDEVVVPEPTYPAYQHIIHLARGKPVFVSCYRKARKPLALSTWNFDIERIKAACTPKTKVILFANPCNPTGDIVSMKTIRELLTWCEARGIFLIVDESYNSFIFEAPFESSTGLVTQSQFLIRVGSYSKSMGMSGWRVGFMIIPDYLNRMMGTAQDAVLCCPNVIAQHAALYALDHPEYTQRFHNDVKESRDLAVAMLQPLADREIIAFAKPKTSFYLLIKTPMEDSFDLCMSILNNAKVGLIPGRAFGASSKAYLRLCYARKKEVLQEGLERIVRYLG